MALTNKMINLTVKIVTQQRVDSQVVIPIPEVETNSSQIKNEKGEARENKSPTKKMKFQKVQNQKKKTTPTTYNLRSRRNRTR